MAAIFGKTAVDILYFISESSQSIPSLAFKRIAFIELQISVFVIYSSFKTRSHILGHSYIKIWKLIILPLIVG